MDPWVTDESTMLRNASILIVCVAAILLTGCASKNAPENQKINQWLAQQAVVLPPTAYKIEPPDVVQITAPGIKEMHLVQQEVRSDGHITLNLIGEVMAAGRTPDEIALELRAKVSKFYGKEVLDIAVQVVEYKSKVIYVFGEVHEPGTKPFTGTETIVQLLAMSKLNTYAWPQKVVVVRPNQDITIRQKVTIDLKHMYETGELAQNYVLEQGDIIFVPASPLAQTGFTLNKMLGALRPAPVVGAVLSSGTGGGF
jgi:polysaccharide export outer membrane protein